MSFPGVTNAEARLPPRTAWVAATAGVALLSGLLLNDWLPTGILEDVGAPGNTDRRDALRGWSVIGPLIGFAVFVARRAIARNLGNLVLTTVAVAFSLAVFVATDVALASRALERARPHLEIADVHVPDPLLGWRPRPRAVGRHREAQSFDVEYVIDEAGYKAVPNTGTPRARLYLFGDSYTFGHGVANDDTYANILAADHLPSDLHVLNAGVMGYGVEQMYGRFLEVEPALRAGDIVVFAPTSQDVKRNMKDFVFPSKLIFGRRVEFGSRYPYYQNGRLTSVELATPANRVLAALFNGRFSKSVFRFAHSAIMSPATSMEAAAMFDAARAACERRGARFLLVFLPQTKERRRGRYEEDVSLFEYVDVMAYFPEDSTALRFETDSHWNRRGHEVAAAALADVLRRNAFVTTR